MSGHEITGRPVEFYRRRRQHMGDLLKEAGIGLIMFIDTEEARDPAIRYFTGHPSDAVLGISDEGKCALFPWDEKLADLLADADIVKPYTEFGRDAVKAAAGLRDALGVDTGKKVEIPPRTSYLRFLDFVETFEKNHVLCRKNGLHEQAVMMRAIKDEYEIECIRTAARITDGLIAELEQGIRSQSIITEMDAALFIERSCREQGCERTGFETLAAGPERSFAIHCFPSYTAEPLTGRGLSILDFGVVVNGYTSDVTLTIVGKDAPSEAEAQLELLNQAYNAALPLYMPGKPLCAPARACDELLNAANSPMPHSLGHGIGLEVHEYPTVRASLPAEEVFRAGMVITIEPGIYHTGHGGCRLENDVLITEAGQEVITHSRIIRL